MSNGDEFPMRRVAILTTRGLKKSFVYDSLFYEPLKALDWRCEEINWRETNGSDLEKQGFDAAIIRSTWDYQKHSADFIQTMRGIDASGVTLLNSLPLVEWNVEKTYLSDLSKRGIDIIPTSFESEDSTGTDDVVKAVHEGFSTFGTDSIVIKPIVGASSNDAYHLMRGKKELNMFGNGKTFFGEEQIAAQLRKQFPSKKQRPYMVQPFVSEIVEEGEISLFMFAGQHSHSIRKRPKQGDFRVQEDYGGEHSLIEPSRELLLFADRIVGAIPEALYMRIDIVSYKGRPSLMELELIEPSLYFNIEPEGSPKRFADAFVKTIDNI